MANFFIDFYNRVRNNGCSYVPKGQYYSHVVYTNVIWLISYLAIIIYSSVNFFLAGSSTLLIGTTLFYHAVFITSFLLIKKGRISYGKHLMILSIYSAIAVFDHLNGPQVFTFLMMFAAIPVAPNIFHFKKQVVIIVAYVIMPLAYLFLSQFYTYDLLKAPVLSNSHPVAFKVFAISLAFILLVIFAIYMILRSSYKQHKLIAESIGLQTTLDNAIGAIWSIDKNFTLIAVNKKYTDSIAEEFAITEMFIGKNIKENGLWDLFSLKIKQQYIDVLSGIEVLSELKINNKEFEIKAVPIFDTKAKIIGATFTSRDITENKKFENDLKEAKQKAEAASRAREHFLSNMSHELRTPLNGIIGLVDILRDEKYLPEQKENFENLSNISRHTVQLVNNILDFAKIEAGKASLDSKRFGLKKFIKKINAVFITATKLKGITFKTTITGNDDIYIKGDEVSLSQVLINLIGNAIKFTEYGTVELKVDIDDAKDASNHYLRFSVIDSGIGIKKEHFSKIFEGFNQADEKTTRKYGGTGLGLSISDKILRLMHSKLKVESEFGKGSCFYFEVSLEKSSYLRHLRSIPADTIKNRVLPNVKILLAEDNAINQIVAIKILEKWQSKVTVVDNGLLALTAAKESDFDIILMDLDMPVMDGYESLSLIKAIKPQIPVIALTAASFDDMDAFLEKKGFNGVVQKPFVKDDLFYSIMNLVENGVKLPGYGLKQLP
jgi:signal transduction histidine kinase